MVRLPVPASTHPKSQLEHHIRRREHKKIVPVSHVVVSELERPRSFSDVESFQRCASAGGDSPDGSMHAHSPRPLSWSPTQFQMNNRIPSRASSSISKSDRYSDSSASINLSDTWSESSDSDSVQSPLDDRTQSNESHQSHSPPRKHKGNPLANVTYWVVDSRNSVEVHKGYADTDKASLHHRSKPRVAHQWNGQTNHTVTKASLVGVHTNIDTM